RLVPERALPSDCSGHLVTPGEIDPASTAQPQRWEFSTYGPLRITEATCTNQPCAAGWAVLRFSTPVRGSEVLRNVRITPATTFTVDDTTEESASWQLQAALRPRSRYTISVARTIQDRFGQPLTGPDTASLRTTGYRPAIDFPTGRMLVERESFRT